MPRLSGRLRALVVLAALALAVPLAACGDDEEVRVAHNEGIYLEIGDLFYQVQISRQLNPLDAEDRSYLVGIPPEMRELSGSETWFAVFLRAYNTTDEEHPPPTSFHIVDTTGEEFRPVPLAPDNIFAYRAELVQAANTLPVADSIALNAPAGGSMLLFKLTEESLANRPLELITSDPEDPDSEYVFTLDV